MKKFHEFYSFEAHLNYVKNFIGIDHVGLGGNYDGKTLN
jgi:microsomal dipeptidase-like Zn-dependent dipeptidase